VTAFKVTMPAGREAADGEGGRAELDGQPLTTVAGHQDDRGGVPDQAHDRSQLANVDAKR
jgi:hypothetical protein